MLGIFALPARRHGTILSARLGDALRVVATCILSSRPTFKLNIPCGDGELPGSGVASSFTYAWRADGNFSKCTRESQENAIIVILELLSHLLLFPRRWTRWDHFVTFLFIVCVLSVRLVCEPQLFFLKT